MHLEFWHISKWRLYCSLFSVRKYKAQSVSHKNGQGRIPNSNEGETEDDYAGGYADIDISEYEDLPDGNLVIYLCRKIFVFLLGWAYDCLKSMLK